MIHKDITYGGKPLVLACDANCGKAWGIQVRPRVMLGEGGDPDDYAYLADGELGPAPACPGTWEGGDGKPRRPEERLNKWCARQCERSEMEPTLEGVRLPDLSRRRYNRFDRQAEADAGGTPS